MLLNLSIFVYIGATMPWSLFGDSSLQMTAWRLVVLAILVLFLRRLPFVIATYKWIPALNNWRQALFTGWFGPIGVGAVSLIDNTSPYVSFLGSLNGPILLHRSFTTPWLSKIWKQMDRMHTHELLSSLSCTLWFLPPWSCTVSQYLCSTLARLRSAPWQRAACPRTASRSATVKSFSGNA